MIKNVFNITVNSDGSVILAEDLVFNKMESGVTKLSLNLNGDTFEGFTGFIYLLARHDHRGWYAVPFITEEGDNPYVMVGQTITGKYGNWAMSVCLTETEIKTIDREADDVVFMSDVFEGLVYDNVAENYPAAAEPNVLKFANDCKYIYELFASKQELLESDLQIAAGAVENLSISVNQAAASAEAAAGSASDASASAENAENSSIASAASATASATSASTAHQWAVDAFTSSEVCRQQAVIAKASSEDASASAAAAAESAAQAAEKAGANKVLWENGKIWIYSNETLLDKTEIEGIAPTSIESMEKIPAAAGPTYFKIKNAEEYKASSDFLSSFMNGNILSQTVGDIGIRTDEVLKDLEDIVLAMNNYYNSKLSAIEDRVASLEADLTSTEGLVDDIIEGV